MSMNKPASLAKVLLPNRTYHALRSHVARRNASRWLKQEGVIDLALQVAERFNYTVQTGPFRGMLYPRSAVVSRHATPAMIGQYERQLYPFLERAASEAEVVVDVGHAEGYYAVGLARQGKRVIAFDVDPHEHRVCKEMGKLNRVSLTLRRWCSPRDLLSLAGGRALVISDIEGGEVDLFTPEVVAALKTAHLMIELHAGTKEDNARFAQRFAHTHVITVVEDAGMPARADLLAFLGDDAQRMAAEYRMFQQWLVASPIEVRTAPPQASVSNGQRPSPRVSLH